ncbi:MAG: endolytic transglycosylase MltG [Flavobacteriales bacterium]|jgi:UPF0755 protein
MKKKGFFLVIGVVLILMAFLGYRLMSSKQGGFAAKEKIIYIIDDIAPEELVPQLIDDSIITDIKSFDLLLKLKSVHNFKSGRYKIPNGISTNSLINKFRAGLQEPLLVKVDGVRNVYQLAATLDEQLKFDSTSFIQAMLSNELLQSKNLRAEEAMTLILPNTYELFWNITPNTFMEKMIEISNEYWSEERLKKAQTRGLKVSEVYTLASIVKGEAVTKSEAPKIAGLYLNRLKKKMALEADPTITFALNMKKTQRIYNKDLSVDSPYNTYKNKGLPPGPIFMVEPLYLDAVLDAESHEYIFMCAQPGGTGLHNFAKDYAQHQRYASLYRSWLNKNNIR